MAEPFVDLGFARVDTDRARRCGFPEVIFGEGKTPEEVVAIGRVLLEKNGVLLVQAAILLHPLNRLIETLYRLH